MGGDGALKRAGRRRTAPLSRSERRRPLRTRHMTPAGSEPTSAAPCGAASVCSAPRQPPGPPSRPPTHRSSAPAPCAPAPRAGSARRRLQRGRWRSGAPGTCRSSSRRARPRPAAIPTRTSTGSRSGTGLPPRHPPRAIVERQQHPLQHQARRTRWPSLFRVHAGEAPAVELRCPAVRHDVVNRALPYRRPQSVQYRHRAPLPDPFPEHPVPAPATLVSPVAFLQSRLSG